MIEYARLYISHAKLDLRTCTREDLMDVYGVGPKTARFFLLHTREFCDEVVLDTHILRWMRERCDVKEAPKNTPQNPEKYAQYAGLVQISNGATLYRLDIGSSRPYDLDRDEWTIRLILL